MGTFFWYNSGYQEFIAFSAQPLWITDTSINARMPQGGKTFNDSETRRNRCLSGHVSLWRRRELQKECESLLIVWNYIVCSVQSEIILSELEPRQVYFERLWIKKSLWSDRVIPGCLLNIGLLVKLQGGTYKKSVFITCRWFISKRRTIYAINQKNYNLIFRYPINKV